MNSKRAQNVLPPSSGTIEADLREIVSDMNKKTNPIKKNLNATLQEARQKLIDWMLVVSKGMKLSVQCYTFAVEIFDCFLEKSSDNLDTDYLHLICVVCIVLASKYEEVKYVSIDTAHRLICHKKHSKEELKAAELHILKTLKYKLERVYFEEFSNLLLECTLKKSSPESKKDILNVTLSIYKLIIQNYNFYRNVDKLTLYFSILYFVLNNEFKIEKLRVSFQSFKFFEIADQFNVKMKDVLILVQQIKTLYDDMLNKPSEYEYLYGKEFILLIK